MHIPDGFINVPVSLGAAGVAAGGVGVALRQATRSIGDSVVPLAGLAAAFVFAAQMLNFPVAAGTSGHLLGGTIAAVLLGPSVGVLVLSVVLAVQGVIFADGGLTAIGLNVVNMAIVGTLVGWLIFRGISAILPRIPFAMVSATMVASWGSVVAASIAFTAEYSIGGSGSIPSATVFRAMVGIHSVIGIGEGIISGLVIAAVLASRPDLVKGAAVMGTTRADRVHLGRRTIGVFVAAGFVVSAALVVFVAPLVTGAPDGLERVAIDHGFAGSAVDSAAASSPLAGYGVAGVEEGTLGTIIAGLAGVVVAFAVGSLILRLRTRASTPKARAT